MNTEQLAQSKAGVS